MSEAITAKTPWVKNLGDVPAHLDYFQGSMYEAVERIARQNPNAVAFVPLTLWGVPPPIRR